MRHAAQSFRKHPVRLTFGIAINLGGLLAWATQI